MGEGEDEAGLSRSLRGRGELCSVAWPEPFQFGLTRGRLFVPNEPGISCSAAALWFDAAWVERNAIAKNPDARRR
jgi:hypothetical protein